MSENKMAEVAKLLGVEFNQEFRLKTSKCIYKITQYGLLKKYDDELEFRSSSLLEDILVGRFTIIRRVNPILDNVEKIYLSGIIRPFKDQVIAIAKRSANYGEFIDIMIDEGDIGDCGNIYLPYFKPNSMYKGMKVNREYTLDQLGL